MGVKLGEFSICLKNLKTGEEAKSKKVIFPIQTFAFNQRSNIVWQPKGHPLKGNVYLPYNNSKRTFKNNFGQNYTRKTF